MGKRLDMLRSQILLSWSTGLRQSQSKSQQTILRISTSWLLGLNERQKTQKSCHHIKIEEESWRTNTAWLQGHYKAIVIAIMNYSQGIGQQTESPRIDSPRIDLHRHHQVTCNKEQMQFNIEMIVFNKQCQNN